MITNQKFGKAINDSYVCGDVIGVYIHLLADKPHFMRDKKHSNHLDDIVSVEILKQTKEEQLEVSNGSYIKFYKNGKLQGLTFNDIYEGKYHAAVSLYMQARCKVNFGGAPFKFKPETDKPWDAYSYLT